MISALFVETQGCYCNLPEIDPWDLPRDARTYAGPNPVIAHPPCQRWGALAFVNYSRWGGEHNRPGNDGGCFEAALAAVNRWGGVLEHPGHSHAWKAFRLKPPRRRWERSGEGWVCAIYQSAYGHRASKLTWLYYKGARPPFELRWEHKVSTHQVGGKDGRGRIRNKPTLGKKEANATPIEFRDELIKLAEWSRGDSGMAG